MFSVPGWNVSAPIATQIEKPKAKNPDKLGKKALKRKEKQEQQVNAENIGELWDKVVDTQYEKSQEASTTATNGIEETGDGAQEKRGKKRKRGKSNKDKKPAEDAPGEGTDGPAQKPTTTENESKRDKKKRKKDTKSNDQSTADAKAVLQSADLTSLIPEPAGLTPLQRSMRSKLASARFRHLNESLYTKPSLESLSLFKDDPSMFEDYHRGFAQQVEVWPSNPVDSYVASILSRGAIRNRDPWKDKKRAAKGKGSKQPRVELEPEHDPTAIGVRLTGDSKPLPRNPKSHTTIADLGCGTASLAYRLTPHLNDLHLTIHSFDLAKPTGPSAPLVTVADISSLPLASGSVDVAIFCLALMGTNWLDFIDEAYRILRWRGELWISEIKSRFARAADGKKVPVNSVGSLRKRTTEKAKQKNAEQEAEEINAADETLLAHAVDGAEKPNATDVSAFIKVLAMRGFVLDALPERHTDAIDLSNKMFVKMQFIKSAQPVAGKNAKEGAAAAEGRFSTDRALKFGIKGKKFSAVAAEERVDDERDRKVLKPCLYKIR
ncbi:methyltransferase-domain-containing protein [Ampelomyces quisqualis]|uniref:Ribosomal RNA-processing protein 8 n=1 Tax=Ampelomyces quisqualis TaxID=50730 RepID=A0A6A5QDI5_AMPQU|nr:methyltransferase-domain-containing protein [Ampelomyces quisqualis]